MFYLLKKYPFSLSVVAAVIYLSFFTAPPLTVPLMPHVDKVVHFCMYGGLSGMLWLEFFRNHRYAEKVNLRHAWLGAVVFPVVLSAVIELMQYYFTTHRSGEWLDLLANICGVATATLVSFYILRPRILTN